MVYTFLLNNYKKLNYIVIIICLSLIIVLYQSNTKPDVVISLYKMKNTNDYLILNTKCTIENLGPFESDVKHLFSPEKSLNCSKHPILTEIIMESNTTILYLNRKLMKIYSKKRLSCCYSYVTRMKESTIKETKCIPFKKNVTLEEEVVRVKCVNSKKNLVYENVHFAVLPRKIPDKSRNNSTLSVLMIGIDSVSRLNLIRSLPKTHKFLTNERWVPLKVYNKVGDNTFPNLMAILTGFNNSYAKTRCNPYHSRILDTCPFIWKTYSKYGYKTAYGEDESTISTFNYQKEGFGKEPTDFYLRTYMMASEELKITTRHGMSYCTGPENTGERILDVIQDFVVALQGHPYFGFFWMNTFSHNDVNSVAAMDDTLETFFQNLAPYLNDTMVVFLSDHGMRFGSIIQTKTGWHEVRLPMINFWFPKWFTEKYPEHMMNFNNNIYKLTTPYDLHMTLQDVLRLSGFNHTMQESDGCKNCKSLFDNIESERSCDECSIPEHWCACGDFQSLDVNTRRVIDAANLIIEGINEKNTKRRECRRFELDRIITARASESYDRTKDTYLLVIVQTSPKAIFEGTIFLHPNGTLTLSITSLTRLDMYSSTSKCVQGAGVKSFCYCR